MLNHWNYILNIYKTIFYSIMNIKNISNSWIHSGKRRSDFFTICLFKTSTLHRESFPLRFLLAKDPKLIGDVLSVVNRALSTYLIKKSDLTKKSGAKTGSVTFIQRFGGSLNLNIHFHMIYLDGVYTFEHEKEKFHFLIPPSQSELNSLLKTIAQRTIKLLEKRGLIIKDEGVENKFLALNPDEPMDYIHSSSITYQIALGKYKGQKALTLGSIPIKFQEEKDKPFLSKYLCFSLHGGVS